jgi:hypothetical protein
MTLDDLLWIATGAYAIHVLEEYLFDWANWTRAVLKLPVAWGDFYITNALVIVLGAVAAEIAPQMPALALCFPALMVINALFFHITPFILFRVRFSPGLFTAVVLFLPVATLCYRAVYVTGLLTGETLLFSFAGGALLMATPIVFLKLKDRPYFVQTQAPRQSPRVVTLPKTFNQQ